MYSVVIVTVFSVYLAMCLQAVEKLCSSGLKQPADTKAGVVVLQSKSKPSRFRTQNGDIRNLRPSGQRTTGVAGSQAAVERDLPELERMYSCYQEVADTNNIQASVIAALASRSSGGGSALYATQGYGDNGHAYGILQCHLETSGVPCEFCPWHSCCHVRMMVAMILMPYIKQVKSKHPTWSNDMALQGGVAAYNFGVRNVQTWARLDIGSTNNDYSNDVIARAQYLYEMGWN